MADKDHAAESIKNFCREKREKREKEVNVLRPQGYVIVAVADS